MYLTDQEFSFKVYTSKIKSELCDQIYGFIVCEYNLETDALLISIERKDFKYGYALTNMTTKFLTISAKDSAEIILSHYRKVIQQWFFKKVQ